MPLLLEPFQSKAINIVLPEATSRKRGVALLDPTIRQEAVEARECASQLNPDMAGEITGDRAGTRLGDRRNGRDDESERLPLAAAKRP